MNLTDLDRAILSDCRGRPRAVWNITDHAGCQALVKRGLLKLMRVTTPYLNPPADGPQAVNHDAYRTTPAGERVLAGLPAKPATAKRINPIGAKRQAKMPARKTCREIVYARAHGLCEIRLPGICTGQCEQVHEPLNRSQGVDITDPDQCVGTCAECHRWITEHSEAARKMGLSLSGARHVTPATTRELGRAI